MHGHQTSAEFAANAPISQRLHLNLCASHVVCIAMTCTPLEFIPISLRNKASSKETAAHTYTWCHCWRRTIFRKAFLYRNGREHMDERSTHTDIGLCGIATQQSKANEVLNVEDSLDEARKASALVMCHKYTSREERGKENQQSQLQKRNFAVTSGLLFQLPAKEPSPSKMWERNLHQAELTRWISPDRPDPDVSCQERHRGRGYTTNP